MASPDTVDESAVVEALRLGEPDERVKKILSLQGRGVWRGDLADMRRDSPRRAAADSNGPSPYAREAMARMATIRRFREALNRLAPRTREVLRLHYDGLSAAEIAERLGYTPAYAAKLIQQSRRRLGELNIDPRENR
jgi:RNA polymerase sigma factor (sigma-70 family)